MGRLLDRLFRERAGRHLAVVPEPAIVRRGERVRATLTLYHPDRVGRRVEVGLVCTETYAERRQISTSTAIRVMANDVAYEEWVPAERNVPVQTFTFTVPPDAPFSYDGENLRFSWRVSAREPRELRLDATSSCALRVLP